MKRFILILLLLGTSLPGCNRDFSPISYFEAPRALTSMEQHIVQTGNRFSWRLFKEIALTEKNKNVVISPLSIRFALAMTLNGAAGTTKAAMLSTMDMEGMSLDEINESFQQLMLLLENMDPKVKFNVANSIWYRQEFEVKADFIDRMKRYYEAEIRGLNFTNPEAVLIINNWVKDKTEGKIEKIIDSIPPETVMYLINALYFKGDWKVAFDKDLTKEDAFYVDKENTIPVQMMSVAEEFPYSESKLFQGIDLYYGNNLYRMTVLLPGKDLSVDSLISLLDETSWEQWREGFHVQKGVIKLPRFTTQYGNTLAKFLSSLGMDICFDPFQADFSKINPDKRLYISNVIHKTYVAVDEVGTEAAAVTAVEVGVTSVGDPGIQFIMTVDRPFLFVIWDYHSKSILFVGKILKPTA